VVKGEQNFKLVDFPKGFVKKDPARSKQNLVVTTGEYEVRILSKSSPGELLFGMKDYDDAYAENFYAVTLDGRFEVRAVGADDWSQAEKVSNTRFDPFSNDTKVTGESLQYRGKTFAKTGRSWESTAALPSLHGRWLAVFSHTSEKDKPSYGVMGGGGRGKGEMFIDVYDTSSGVKVLSANAPHQGGDKPSRLFNNTFWVGDSYLVVPLDADAWNHDSADGHGESVLLGILPGKQ
jgi:hypothetical protein